MGHTLDRFEAESGRLQPQIDHIHCSWGGHTAEATLCLLYLGEFVKYLDNIEHFPPL